MTDAGIDSTSNSRLVGSMDDEPEVLELWDIIDHIKQKANDYALTHSPTEPVIIKSKRLKKLEANDLEFVRQRLNGTGAGGRKYSIRWDATAKQYYLTPLDV